jgi:hypothetical protein
MSRRSWAIRVSQPPRVTRTWGFLHNAPKRVVGKKRVRGTVFAQHRCVMVIGSYRSFPCVAPTLLESEDDYFHWPASGLKYSPDPAASTTNNLGIFVFPQSAVRVSRSIETVVYICIHVGAALEGGHL